MACRVLAQAELPLTGAAFVIAGEAYKAYSQENYSLAAEKAREAIRLRPDVPALRALLSRAEAAERGIFAGRKRDKTNDATSPSNTRSTHNTRNTTTSSRTSKKTKRSEGPPDQPAPIAADASPDPAFLQAQSAYKAYEVKAYAGAATYASEAVRLAPGNLDYRYLLVNALIAADRLNEADEAAAQALLVTPGDGGLAAQQQQIRAIRAQKLAASAYVAFDAGDFALAANAAREAINLAPSVPNYRTLLTNALFRAGQYAEAEKSINLAMAANSDASLFSQRGFIRQRQGMADLARQDFESALSSGGLPVTTEIELLVEVGRKGEAKSKFDSAMAAGLLRDAPDAQVAYLAVRVNDDQQALAAFNRADAAGTLQNTAYQDAAFAALRSRNDAQAISYFKRTIDEVDGGRLQMEPQLLFNTRRAVAEVSREWELIASLSYRGAVPGAGVTSGTANSLQGGAEAYWRPWGFNNGQYAEVFARAFQTLHSSGGGATGADTLQAAFGLRYKPLTEQNLVVSLSRVMSPGSGHNDWLGQLAYSADRGTDLRVDVPSWWTLRSSAEVGRYFSGGQSYALGHLQAGKSFRLGDDRGRWVLFPHLSLAANYDSAAIERSSVGFGPGVTARYWFREDRYAAPRSYVDVSARYRFRISGAARAKGLFVEITVSY